MSNMPKQQHYRPIRPIQIAVTAFMIASSTGYANSKDGEPTSPINPISMKASTVCAACHGANGISVAEHIPNLAGQRGSYIAGQLRAFKSGNRKNEVMQAIAAQLSNADINALAQHFSTVTNLPTKDVGTKSAYLSNLTKSTLRIPADFKTQYVQYHKRNIADSRQLKIYYANDVAIKAVKAGKSLPDGSAIIAEVFSIKLNQDRMPIIGADGFYVADKLLAHSAMERDAGWGDEIPEMLRNENWNYALYSKDHKPIPTINHAECLACHQPEGKSSYMFTYKDLVASMSEKK